MTKVLKLYQEVRLVKIAVLQCDKTLKSNAHSAGEWYGNIYLQKPRKHYTEEMWYTEAAILS